MANPSHLTMVCFKWLVIVSALLLAVRGQKSPGESSADGKVASYVWSYTARVRNCLEYSLACQFPPHCERRPKWIGAKDNCTVYKVFDGKNVTNVCFPLEQPPPQPPPQPSQPPLEADSAPFRPEFKLTTKASLTHDSSGRKKTASTISHATPAKPHTTEEAARPDTDSEWCSNLERMLLGSAAMLTLSLSIHIITCVLWRRSKRQFARKRLEEEESLVGAGPILSQSTRRRAGVQQPEMQMSPIVHRTPDGTLPPPKRISQQSLSDPAIMDAIDLNPYDGPDNPVPLFPFVATHRRPKTSRIKLLSSKMRSPFNFKFKFSRK